MGTEGQKDGRTDGQKDERIERLKDGEAKTKSLRLSSKRWGTIRSLLNIQELIIFSSFFKA